MRVLRMSQAHLIPLLQYEFHLMHPYEVVSARRQLLCFKYFGVCLSMPVSASFQVFRTCVYLLLSALRRSFEASCHTRWWREHIFILVLSTEFASGAPAHRTLALRKHMKGPACSATTYPMVPMDPCLGSLERPCRCNTHTQWPAVAGDGIGTWHTGGIIPSLPQTRNA